MVDMLEDLLNLPVTLRFIKTLTILGGVVTIMSFPGHQTKTPTIGIERLNLKGHLL